MTAHSLRQVHPEHSRRARDPALPSHLRRGELERLALLLRHATDGAWAVALYNTVAIRDRVMEALRVRLAPLPVCDFTFAAERTNPLDYLAQLPPEARAGRATIFLSDLSRARGQVWGYLETHREALAGYPHGLVFWLTPAEREEAIHRAPNFWSQRSGVFDFTIADEVAPARVRGRWAGAPLHFVDRSDWERQVRLYQKLLEEYQRSGDAPADTLLDLYGKLGWLHYAVGDYSRAGELARRQRVLAEESDDRAGPSAEFTVSEAKLLRAGLATSYNNIGIIYAARGDYEAARGWYEKSVAITEALGDRAGLATTLHNLGYVAMAQDDYAAALDHFTRSRDLSAALGLEMDVAEEEEMIARTRARMGAGDT